MGIGTKLLKVSSWTSALSLCAVMLAACGEEPPLPGERFSLREPGLESVVNRTTSVSLPSQRANTDWTHLNGSAAHVAGNPAFTTTPALLWSADVGPAVGEDNRITSPPIASGGLVYTLNTTGQIVAINAGGGVVWQQSIIPVGERAESGTGGGLAVSGARLVAATGFGELVVLNAANGDIIWRRQFEAPFRAAPAINGDTIFAVTRADVAFGISLDDGGTEWMYRGATAITRFNGGSSPAAGGNYAILPFGSGDIIGVRAHSGDAVWRIQLDEAAPGTALGLNGDISGSPVISGNAVYVGNISGQTAKYNLATGDRIWSLPTGATDPVIVAGNSVFVMSQNAQLVRASASNGELIWVQSLPEFEDPEDRKDRIPQYGPILAGSTLWVAGRDGHLRGFAPDSGALVADVAVPGGVAAAPIVVGRVMYILSLDGKLHAFQ